MQPQADVVTDSDRDAEAAASSVTSTDGWQPVQPSYVVPDDITFTGQAEITAALLADAAPIDVYNALVTDDIVQLMVTETNRYAEQFLQAKHLKPKSRMHRWHATDATEMKKFLGILYTMGIVKKPFIENYWSTDPVLATPLVNSIMARDRFELLLKFWHFSNNETVAEGDRLHKLQSISDLLLQRFQDVFTPGKELSIDESMVLWRGRLVFRQYIPGKKHKYGVKLYLLCDPAGYVWNAIVYCGRSDVIAGLGHAEAVVMKLMEKRLDLGHELYIDNFYTSVPLAKELLRRKTLVCGTLRRNRKFLPQAVVGAKLKKGEITRRRHERIVVTKWHDNRDVLMLSTFHTGQLMDSPKVNRRGERIRKPDCVLSYNQNMCGIDRADQLLSYYTPLRKTIRWYKKVVLHFLDMAMTNAYLIYRKRGGTQAQVWFRMQVIRALVTSQDRDSATTADTDTTLARPFFHHKSGDLSRNVWTAFS